MCFSSRKKNASYIFIFVNYFKKKTFFSTGRNYREDIRAFWDGGSYRNTKRNLVMSQVPDCLQSNICVVHVMGKQVAFHLALYGMPINSIYLLNYYISGLWWTTEHNLPDLWCFPGMVTSALWLVAGLFQPNC